MTPTTLANRYLLQSELGAGGMGTVYRGMDTHTGQTVAVKQLRAELSQPDMIERFRREGQALRDLNHPNIVKLLDTLEHDGQHYLVMEYVPGGDLTRLIQQGRLPHERVVELALDLADALTRAHRLNILHRDLKPANVLISEDGTLRLTDFGVAHVGSKARVTGTGAIIGTLDYLPPEIFDDKPFDARGDIWAFGVMLFELLAGKHPFSGDSVIQVIQAITTKPVPDLEVLCDAPITLVDLVYRMLEKDPNRRIRSVRVIGVELEALLNGHAGEGEISMTIVGERFAEATEPIHPHNLPAETTPFVGRKAELRELDTLLRNSSNRLITILAPGGMGKTRLGVEIGRSFLGQGVMPSNDNPFPDGVFIVQLAPLEITDQIVSAIADALKFQFYPGGEPRAQLLDYLRAKSIMIIMDNFEHLLDGAEYVTQILEAAPRVTILATSRARLTVRFETVFTLGAMDFPDWETPEDALQYGAVQLFMQSARRAKPAFELTAGNLDYVARICKLVQGLPLGLELAAAWLEMLHAEEIAAEIQRSADFLESNAQDLPERQRSIRAVFDYSWKMLNEHQRGIVRRLAVFRGGFSRSAAQTVTGAGLRDLMTLVNVSAIQRDPDSGDYAMHELLRQYAEEHLDASGEAGAVRDAHSDYYLTALFNRRGEIETGAALGLLGDIESDLGNVRAALLWAAQRGHYGAIDGALRMVWFYATMRAQFDQGSSILDEVARIIRTQPASQDRDTTLAYTLTTHARIAAQIHATKRVQSLIEEAEPLLTEAAPAYIRAYFYLAKGFNVADTEGPAAGRPLMEKGLDLFRAAGDRWGEAEALRDLGNVYWYMVWRFGETENWEQARVILLEAYTIQQQSGDVTNIARTTMNLATAENGVLRQEKNVFSPARYMEALGYARGMGDRYREAGILMNLGVEYGQRGEILKSLDYHEQALAIYENLGNLVMIDWTRDGIAECFVSLGDYARAAVIYREQAQMMAEAGHLRRSYVDRLKLSAVLALQGEFDEAVRIVQEILALNSEPSNIAIIGQSQRYIITLFAQMGDFTSARSYLEPYLELLESGKYDEVPARWAYYANAMLEFQAGNYAAARELADQHAAFIDRSGAPRHILRINALRASIAAAQGRLDEARANGLEALRLALGLENVPSRAMALQGWLDTLIASQDRNMAVQVATCLQHDPRTPAHERRWAGEKLAKLRAASDGSTFSAAVERGKTLAIEAMIAALLAELGSAS